jgi:hypothetical protein
MQCPPLFERPVGYWKDVIIRLETAHVRSLNARSHDHLEGVGTFCIFLLQRQCFTYSKYSILKCCFFQLIEVNEV